LPCSLAITAWLSLIIFKRKSSELPIATPSSPNPTLPGKDAPSTLTKSSGPNPPNLSALEEVPHQRWCVEVTPPVELIVFLSVSPECI